MSPRKVWHVLLTTMYAAAVASAISATPKTDKSDLQPITITFDQPPAEVKQKSSGAPPKPTPTPVGNYRTTAEVKSELGARLKAVDTLSAELRSGDNVTSLASATAAGIELLSKRTANVNPHLIAWREVAEKLNNSRGLTPDFKTISEVEERIALYIALEEKTGALVQSLSDNFKNIDEDLQANGVPEAKAKTATLTMYKEFKLLNNRMKIGLQMSETATAALKVLKDEWGNWQFSESAGLMFLPPFKTENKAQYNTLVKEYKQQVSSLQAIGGFE